MVFMGNSIYRLLDMSAESLLSWASWIVQVVCPEFIVVTNEYHVN